MSPAPAPPCRQNAPISDFLDLASLSIQEKAALATNWIKDRPKGLKLQNLALATRTGPVFHRQLQGIFPRMWQSFDVIFCRRRIPNAVCYFRVPSVTILTSLRPAVTPLPGCSSVRVCPAAQFDFFSAAFGPREWTMVVFWKEYSGRQLRLITPENGRGDETSSPSPPRLTFFDDPDVPLGPSPPPPGPPDPPGLHQGAPSSSTCW